jgi:predicted nuclease of restriction endonuclease-like (RecB) superfamily
MEVENTHLVIEIKKLIETSKNIAVSVNTEMTLLYWNIGKRVNEEIEQYNEEIYGKKIVATLWLQLSEAYGNSFSEKNLRRMMQFAKIFPDEKFVVSVIRQLSWTHLLAVIPIEDPLKRDFYIEMCKIEKWSVRTFRERINSMLYERTAISKKPELTIKNELDLLKNEQKLTADLVFKDPYVLDFLNLKDTYSEKDLEGSILVELQKFIIELGSDFAFLARQKRISIDNEDYYIDLLFFNLKLNCYVVFELKAHEFDPKDVRQIKWYMELINNEIKEPTHQPTIGIILSKNNDHLMVEYMLSNNQDPLGVATFNKYKALPEKYAKYLPSEQEIINRLANIGDTNIFSSSE